MNLERDVMFAKTSLEQKRLVRHNLLLACKLRSLPVSVLSGILQEISEVQVRAKRGEILPEPPGCSTQYNAVLSRTLNN